ncbi:heme ABC transporter substrate-binding protein IsdE [Peptoniphilus asaccharolyticus]
MKSKISVIILSLMLLCGCVDQSQGKKETSADYSKKIDNPKIVVTSMATAFIMNKLEVDLIAVPDSKVDKCPERYKNLPKIGVAMTPDMEKIKSMQPNYIFSPVSLISDLLPKYEAANLNYGFLNLNNLDGMYKSIGDLGDLLDRREQADRLITEYKENLNKFNEKYPEKKSPRVLILMGLPGSYVVATENSYVGSLVSLTGGENVYSGSDKQFLTINTEDMLGKNPDIILRTSHAMPEQVMKMFRKDFETNDIWKHFEAVQKGKVYDLDHSKFGMSAKFNYPEALEDLGEIFYEKN